MTTNRTSSQKNAQKAPRIKRPTRTARKAVTPLPAKAAIPSSDGKGAGNGHQNGGQAHPALEASRSRIQLKPVANLRQDLERERSEVEQELGRLSAELKQTPEATGDEVDLSVYDRERTLALIARYQQRLEEVDHALRAAQKGAYGICERCGNAIDPARLKIFPETTLCVQCKNEKERLAKRGLL